MVDVKPSFEKSRKGRFLYADLARSKFFKVERLNPKNPRLFPNVKDFQPIHKASN